MTHQFSPLLSAKLLSGTAEQIQKNIEAIKFPVIASPKYDGWRLFEYNGQARTRSLKVPKNYSVRRRLAEFYKATADVCSLRGIDGEVIVGSPTDYNAMQNTTSGVGTYEGEPEITYFVFDSYQHSHLGFQERYDRLVDCLLPTQVPSEFPWVQIVEQVTIHNLPDLWAYERKCLELGYEGIMFRSPQGHYKMGRSSIKEGILVAVKRWATDEAEILEVREQMHNANEATTNALGHTERSSHQENLHGKGTMGSVLCRSKKFDETFSVGYGRGLDDALRQYIWDHPEEFVGQMLMYRYQDIGIKTRPRNPGWIGIRHRDDMGPE